MPGESDAGSDDDNINTDSDKSPRFDASAGNDVMSKAAKHNRLGLTSTQ